MIATIILQAAGAGFGGSQLILFGLIALVFYFFMIRPQVKKQKDHKNYVSELKKGDRVGLFLPNTPFYLILYFAILKVGGVVVNFNPLYAEREIQNQINNSGATIMAAPPCAVGENIAAPTPASTRVRLSTPIFDAE